MLTLPLIKGETIRLYKIFDKISLSSKQLQCTYFFQINYRHVYHWIQFISYIWFEVYIQNPKPQQSKIRK